LWLEADIRRLYCRRCDRVVTEEVAWARPGAWHSRDFEDVVAWLAPRTDKTTIATLLPCRWKAVDNIIRPVVAENLDAAGLEGLYPIGVDEISSKRGHYYLTVVADHDSGQVVWVAPGKRGEALADFYDALGPQGRERIEAVAMDLATIYASATTQQVPHAVICYDPSM
jgi:transposase